MLETAMVRDNDLILPSGHLTYEFLDLDRVPPLELASAYARKIKQMEDVSYKADALAFFAKPSYMQLAPTTLMGYIADKTKKDLVQIDLRNPDWIPVRIKGGESKDAFIVADAIYLPSLYEEGVYALEDEYQIKGVVLAHPSPKESRNERDPEKVFSREDIPVHYLEKINLPELGKSKDIFFVTEPTSGLESCLRETARLGKKDSKPFYLWNLGDGIRTRKLRNPKGIQSIISLMLPGIVDNQRVVYAAGSSNQCVTFGSQTRKKFKDLYNMLGDVAVELREQNELKAFSHFRDFALKAQDFSDVVKL